MDSLVLTGLYFNGNYIIIIIACNLFMIGTNQNSNKMGSLCTLTVTAEDIQNSIAE